MLFDIPLHYKLINTYIMKATAKQIKEVTPNKRLTVVLALTIASYYKMS